MQHNVRVTDPTAAFEYGDKFAMVFQPLHFACESGGEGLAALGATTVDDGAAGTGAHTQTETVLHVTTAVVRLECPLHNLMLPVFLPRLSVAPHESSSTNVL